MPRLHISKLVLMLFLSALMLIPGKLHAQTATATVQGTVTDPTGAAVPAANLELRNTATGQVQTVPTDAQGRFTVPNMPVGNYDVTASKGGFQTTVRRGITLNVGAEVVVDFSLQVGQQTQTVTVEAAATQVETTNSAVGTEVTGQQMRELPLNGRDFEQLIQMTAGVNQIGGNAFTSSGFQGRAPEYSISGSRPVGQAILLDDENLQNFWNKGMGSVIGSSLGVEAIGEFETLTNTYSAQFGGNGGVINAVSRSGTNSFHGSAYEFLRNSDLDARQFIDPSQIPAFRQNQFGGSLGGPIKKDKMFFFVNYEGIRLVRGETKLGNVPGCNSDETLPGLGPNSPGCKITATNPTAAQAIANTFQLWPAATRIVNGQPEAATTATQNAHENYVLGRWDYNISSKDSIFARYISDKSAFFEPYGGGGFGGGAISPNWPEQDYSHTQFATIEWRRIISPTLINVARDSFSRPGENEYSVNSPTSLVNGTDPLAFFGAAREDGLVNITGVTGIGGALQLPFNTTQNRYSEGDDLTWTHGAHTTRVGASVSRLQSNTYMPFFSGSMWVFTGVNSGPFPFTGGVPTILFYVPLGSYPNRDFRDIEFTPYVQDDWKISPKLTLNLGLRWEFVTNPIDEHNQLYYVTNVATATAPYWQHVPSAMASNPAWRNFDPRVGLSYDPFGDHKTAIRLGFGIFHDPLGINNIAPGFWSAYPWVASELPGAAGARYPFIPSPGGLNVAKPSDATGWDYDAESTPYMIQYNLNVQREIAPNTVLNVGYIGSRGLHLLTETENNPPLLCTFAQGPDCANPTAAYGTSNGYFGYGTPGSVTANPQVNNGLGTFPNLTPEAWSRYNSLLVSLDKRFSHGFQTNISYIWSRCVDDGGYLGSFNTNSTGEFENPYDLNLDKGVCATDITDSFKVNGLWTLPFHGNRALEGWQLSGILTANSGLPINIVDGYDEASGGVSGGISAVRPNYSPNNPAYSSGNLSLPACNGQVLLHEVDLWYNPNCFSLQAPGTLGNTGRDVARGPHFVDTDISLSKNTKLTEQLGLQLRADFFNIFNHTNLGLPTTGTAGGLFVGGGGRNGSAGQILTMVGTPRQIQFSAKFVF